jgi:uncharacterized protein
MRLIFSMLCLFGFCTSLQAASFSCQGKLSADEKLICETPVLSALDYKLSQLYSVAYAISDSRQSLKEQQLQWLSSSRKDCHQQGCLKERYEKRIAILLDDLQSQSDGLPSSLKGMQRQVRSVQTAYCNAVGEPEYVAEFNIDAKISADKINGHIDGIVDCGRRAWDSDFAGTVKGKLAFVEYDAGFNEPEILQAIVLVSKGILYWRSLTEGQQESYIPDKSNIKLVAKAQASKTAH